MFCQLHHQISSFSEDVNIKTAGSQSETQDKKNKKSYGAAKAKLLLLELLSVTTVIDAPHMKL